MTQASIPELRQNAPRLSVVFSFWNEQDVLPELISRLRKTLSAEVEKGTINAYEAIFVNDASTDNSLAILMDHAQGHDDIRVINMSRNFGVSPCVLAGMIYSTGDLVVYMDADLQDPPELIPRMLEAWKSSGGADVVHTVRRKRAGEGKLKLFITRIGYKILKRVSTVPLKIEAGDFKMLSRRAVNELVHLREKKPFMRGLVSWIGFKQTEVIYEREARRGGETKFPVLGTKVIRNFLDSALISFSDIPLQISTLVGFLVSACAFLYLVWLIIEKIFGLIISDWSVLMVAILLLGGLQMLSLGILGLYVNSIFLEAKGRPNFIVESVHGFPKETPVGSVKGRDCPHCGNPQP